MIIDLKSNDICKFYKKKIHTAKLVSDLGK